MREHWTLAPDLIYLNHGSFGAVPRVTQEAQRQLQAEAESNPMRWFRDLPQRLVRTRETVGTYLGVSGADIALVPNATTGVDVALRSLSPAAGGRFVVTSHAYGAVLLAVDQAARRRDCESVVVDLPIAADDNEIVAALDAALGDNAVCIVVDQITSATAKVLPVEQIAELGRRRGVPVIVDGAHAPALLDRPVTGDFWTGNLHKWPCAPRGTGVLYVAPERRADVRPPVVSWDFPAGFPLALDFPGTTDTTGWLAAPVSLELLVALGFSDERKRLGELVAAGAEMMAQAVGSEVVDVGTPAPTMRLVALPDGLISDDVEGGRLGAYLAARTGAEVAVSTWAGHGFLRLSAHLYSHADDFAVAASRFAPLFADREQLEKAVRP